jgi:hypothetical protein
MAVLAASTVFPGVTLAGWIFVPFVGLLLTFGGLGCLLYLVPRSKQDANLRTDIFAVKACYWLIVVGLVCTSIWLLSAVLVRSLVVLKATQVIH